MVHRKNLLLTNGAGEVQAVVGELNQDLLAKTGRYRILLSNPELMILRRSERAGDQDPRERVLMAGEIVGMSTILEVVNLISSSRWIGSLHVFGEDSHRILGFYKGALRHAHSDDPEDRLDKVLFRIGVLNPAKSEAAMRDIKPDQRFGEVLVERGLVARQDLFGYLQRQMESVLLSAGLEETGTYVFYVFDDPGGTPTATAHIPLHRLLLTAAERLDRYTLCRQLIPSLDLCPQVEPGVEVTQLEPRARLVLGYCDGARSLREIASETWLGRFETMETAYRLLRNGQIRLGQPKRNGRELAETVIAPFNASLHEIYDAVDRWGALDQLREEMHNWLGKNGDHSILRQALGQDGVIAASRVGSTLEEGSARYQVEALQHALHELTSFALFSAAVWLPREDERDLTRRVNRLLKAVER